MDDRTRPQAPIALIPPGALALDADFPPLSMALFEVLLQRRSGRDFSPEALPLYLLSRLLWAAFGINRPVQGGRTAGSVQEAQQISVYLALASGLYRYNPLADMLHPVLEQDLRAATGDQEPAALAPVELIYVATLDPASEAARAQGRFYAGLDTGHISQNVFLFCAAEGLAVVARGQLDRPGLARRMQLQPRQEVILAQSVGYPPRA